MGSNAELPSLIFKISLTLTLIVIGLTFLGILRVNTEYHGPINPNYVISNPHKDYSSLLKELSAIAMARSKDFLRYQCKMEPNGISSSGGWCLEDSRGTSSQHAGLTDGKLAQALSDFFNGSRVASFGDGPGGYKKHLDQTGKLLVYDAYDGAPFCEEVTNGSVKFLDLTIPVYGLLPNYDWVISLEVAEHIPAQHEKVFLDNIVRHAGKGVVMSWAVPGQNGHGHVNCRNISYISQQMAQRGFIRDKPAGRKLREAAVLSWLKANVNVYRRENTFN